MTEPRAARILNVDDNDPARYATSRVLKEAGFEVWEAGTGAEALRQAAQGPDLVLLDVNLPDIGGLEVCRRLKSDPATRGLPVLHLSATRVQTSDRVAGLDGGADGYLVQPIEPEELTAAIRALLRMKESEKRARAAESRLFTTLRSIGDAVLATDGEGRVELLNPVAETLTGWTQAAARGRPLDEVFRIVNEETRAAVETPVARVLGEGAVVGLANHTLLIARDGTELAIVDSAAPIRGEDGAITGVVLVFRDQTAERAAERERREAQANLLAANEELEAFSYTVSHDLRAPLRAIAGFASILGRRYGDRLDETGRRYVATIEASGEQLGILIEELLGYSRIGHRIIRAEPVPLAPMIERLLVTFGERIAAAGGTLEVIEPLAVPDGDPVLLERILVSLVENALTYHRPDVAPVVTISAVRHGERVTLAVADNGIGIPAEYHERIFEVFTRLHGEDAYPGTGIGLAIVRKAARLMGSDITINSEVGVGSTFSLALPAGVRRPRSRDASATDVSDQDAP